MNLFDLLNRGAALAPKRPALTIAEGEIRARGAK